ncbi:MAG TPA: glycosyl hydrolase family 28-related protein [Armatimonadota bacterium]|jgi:hypothetical protein
MTKRRCGAGRRWLLPVLALALLGGGGALGAGPALFWAADPVRPGETLLLTGARLTPETVVQLAPLPGGDAGQPAEFKPPLADAWQDLKPLAVGEQAVHVVLPATGPLAMYLCRVKGGDTVVKVNAPQVFWMQSEYGSSVAPGDLVRVFGACLDFGGQAKMALRGPADEFLPLAPAPGPDLAARTPYALAGVAPADLKPGVYGVWVHNGLGGPAGWAPAGAITVAPRQPPWPERVFNVLDYGAKPNDKADQTAAFQKALDAAAAQGGTVRVPRGRFVVKETLTLAPQVRLQGAGRELTTITWPDRPDALPVLVKGTNSFALEDLTLYATNFRDGVVADYGDKPGAGNVQLLRVRLRLNQYRSHLERAEVDKRFGSGLPVGIKLGGDNVRVVDCDIVSSGQALFFSRMRNGYVAGNRFGNGRWGWYCISGSNGLIFERNEVVGSDLMATGGGLNCLDGSRFSGNVYFAHNRLHDMYGWDREAMTSDAGGGCYLGLLAGVRDNVIQLAADPETGGQDWRGAGVFLIDGMGAGQYRRVKTITGRTVTLDRPFLVDPDPATLVSITMLQQHYLLIGNDFADATIAVQYYGISIEHITAENTCARAGGYHAMGMNYYGWQPSWFQRFLGNRITEGNGWLGPMNNDPATDSHIALLGSTPPNAGPMNRGAVIRDNVLENNANINVNPSWRGILVENNTIRQSDQGIVVDQGVPELVLRGNKFEQVTTPLTGAGAPAGQAP